MTKLMELQAKVDLWASMLLHVGMYTPEPPLMALFFPELSCIPLNLEPSFSNWHTPL